MTIMLDSNVLLDAVASREPFASDAQEILRACARGECSCHFTANSATDIYYVIRKTRGVDIAKETVGRLLYLLPAVSVSGTDCKQALELPISDFEDALLAVCSAKIQADYIVTRDNAFLGSETQVETVSPAGMLALLK